MWCNDVWKGERVASRAEDQQGSGRNAVAASAAAAAEGSAAATRAVGGGGGSGDERGADQRAERTEREAQRSQQPTAGAMNNSL